MFNRKSNMPEADAAKTTMQDSGAPAIRRKGQLEAIDWIERHALISPEAIAQIDLASGRRYTYTEMNERVGRVAAHLAKLGLKPGDRVGYLAMNSTDVTEMIFGTWRLGAVSLALNYRLTAQELAFIIGDAGADVIIADQEFSGVVEELREITDVSHWLITDGLGGDTPYERALADASPLLKKGVRQSVSDMCMLMYSSGTTGRPKGVVITHEVMLFAAINAGIAAALTSRSTFLASMPLFHIGAINTFTFPVTYAGGLNIIQRTFDAGETLRVFNDRNISVTHFLGVPAIFNALLVHPQMETTDFSRLELAVTGAETVPDPLVLAWFERGVRLQEGYGMTEAPCCCLLPKSDVPRKIGSAGKPTLHTEVRVMRVDGQQAEPGELGELWWRGPNVTPGYWNRPDANEDAFVDGWLRSGDIGKIDEEGFIYIEDRLKDMYISGGENVYPAEVENILYDIETISEVAVIGVPDSKWGEVGCAIVALKSQETLTLEELHAFCQSKLAKYKIPAHLLTVEALPRNATGKVLKPVLRQTASDLIEPN
ncbi:acyl-CoA synthetase [Hyphomonas sp. NPDC076900]|uniref:acyl-CoA synthetase n=1 Tax=unclassified Hyphomonas TaxID=2630699 RepID=UPI003CFFE0C5